MSPDTINQAILISNNATVLISLGSFTAIAIIFFKVIYDYAELKTTVKFIQRDVKTIAKALNVNSGE